VRRAISGEVRHFTTKFHGTWVQEVHIERLGAILELEGAETAQESGTGVAVMTDRIALTPPCSRHSVKIAFLTVPSVVQETVVNEGSYGCRDAGWCRPKGKVERERETGEQEAGQREARTSVTDGSARLG
jgi:hypothetical protein